MRKFLLLALALPFLFTACDSTSNVGVEGVVLMPEVHTQVGLTVDLEPSFVPLDATNRAVTWVAINTPPEDEDAEFVYVIRINDEGLAVGAAVGIGHVAVITADGGHTDTSMVRVFPFFEDGCNALVSGGNFFGGTHVGENLTMIRFAGGGSITVGSQQWSPPVRGCGDNRGTTAPAATNFTGVTPVAGVISPAGVHLAAGGTFNADCRVNFNPAIEGDLWSWCAVVRFGHLMCPPGAGWRVPTAEDFAILDRYVRGHGTGREPYVCVETANRFRDANIWRANSLGMIMSGSNAATAPTASNPSPGITGRGVFASYWSQTEHSATGAYGLFISESGQVTPQYAGAKSAGRTVRCVRDVQ